MAGPLAGVRVVELAGLAPGPFACTVLADLGADVIRVDRATPGADVLSFDNDPLRRSRRSIGINTKTPEGVEVVLSLVERSDVLVEGFRPGVTERMGLGPADCLARNPRLIYGRITGWGQDGPLAQRAGHDINYLGLAGALEPIGRAGERPVPPLNLVADFGGGGMLLAVGILAALVEREKSGKGQVVDAAMVDGSALLATSLFGLRATGVLSDKRGENLLDGGAPFYDTYETADGKYVAVGALEERFWQDLLRVLKLTDRELPPRFDKRNWPELRKILAEEIGKYTRDELSAMAEETDACLTPVLTPEEAPTHPHNAARRTFVPVGETILPAPAPRFDRTPTADPSPPHEAGADTEDVLAELGMSQADIERLRAAGAIA
ncbi:MULTISPECIES: CaiB/BaiF CoA-transferase family protein [Thermocrispum]|jgi:alpha-methylacyl-CoA racemase|uniref:CaiB/BaiF CoA-transferase family protein n=1 Tax=Thermocrispum agreste TaxID=37925 RepID=A0A2W4JS28_9PSEU|nr:MULTISPECIES: CaiB/BaiF CoA-transferase family protein [Thermocrispum]PZM96597.1 MAG: CoA transferase [Thermocrispum agreste]